MLVEPVPQDIRQVSVVDPGERADPAQRRRVIGPDEAAASVNRATLAIAEIRDRDAIERAHTDETEVPEPDRPDVIDSGRDASHDDGDVGG